MRITKLHLIILIMLASGYFVGRNVYRGIQIERQKQELERIRLVEEERARREELERQKAQQMEAEYLEKRKILSQEAIAVAGEYWKIAKKDGLDVSVGQATLKTAKETFAEGEYDRAWALAHQAIKELKEAKTADKKYIVVRGDNLWKIASMKKHFGRGEMWPYIWQANKDKIKNPRIIYPKQRFLIPVGSWENYKTAVNRYKKARARSGNI